jgi:hypothetical protein
MDDTKTHTVTIYNLVQVNIDKDVSFWEHPIGCHWNSFQTIGLGKWLFIKQEPYFGKYVPLF